MCMVGSDVNKLSMEKKQWVFPKNAAKKAINHCVRKTKWPFMPSTEAKWGI